MTIMMTLTTKMMILMILVYRHGGVIGQERVGGVGEADYMVQQEVAHMVEHHHLLPRLNIGENTVPDLELEATGYSESFRYTLPGANNPTASAKS